MLAERPELESRALAERLIAAGAVLVDGERRAKSYRLEGGEEVTAEIPGATVLQAEALDVPIVWEDEHLLVVDKPAGIVVHPAGSTRTGTLVQGLLDHGAEGGDDDDRPGIVHRLDRDTSGLLVVARSAEAFALLQELIRVRQVERTYAALVRGTPQSASGRIDAPIGRDRRDRTRHSLDTPTPREAVTWFEVCETMRAPRAARRAARNRSDAPDPRPSRGDRAAGQRRPGLRGRGDLGLERQFLHARRLAFTHPVTRAEIDVTSDLPADLVAALALARSA